ncbi:dihydrofolate reductase [Metabacillus herbersteinensis]|uniref:Dihydrofolate reductase n=1 Tax=Metabacillus herbersteinensis TaxID=283816 RepID=A0ABV6GLT6_9BACI
MISLLVARDENGVIGNNNQLPWHLPADLAYFKRVTMNHKIIMGRKTFQSIGRILPGRENIVLTRDPAFSYQGCTVLHSIEEMLQKYEHLNEEIFVIGGAEIFKEVLPHANRLYITEIHHAFEGDTFFPDINSSEWRAISKEAGVKDDRNPYNYEYVVYER